MSMETKIPLKSIAAMKIDTEPELHPESIRHLLKLLPKRDVLRRIQNSEVVLNKKYHSRLTLDTSIGAETSRKNRDYSSIQSLIDENKKCTLEETKQYADLDEKNNESSSEVDVCLDGSSLEGTTFQNRANELKDQLSESFLFNEDELNREMSGLRNQIQNLISNDIVAEKLCLNNNREEQTIEDIDDIMKQTECLVSLIEKEKNTLLMNSQIILSNIMAIKTIISK